MATLDIIKDPATGNQYSRDTAVSGSTYTPYQVDTTKAIPADRLTSSAVTLPSPVTTSTAQGALSATVDSTANNIYSTQQADAAALAAAPTPTATPNSGLKDTLSQILGISNQIGTRGARTLEIQQAEGVDQKKKELDKIDQEILSKTRAYDKQLRDIPLNNPTGRLESGQSIDTQRVSAQRNSELADLSIQRFAANGDYATAFDIAQKKVDAEFEPLENQLETLKTYYQLSQNDMTESEKLQAQAKIQEKESEIAFGRQKELLTYEQQIKQKDPQYKANLHATEFQNNVNDQLYGVNDPVSAASLAILGNESGGSYDTQSPILPSGSHKGERSYGKYQVLESNIPSWTKEFYGQSLTPQEFLANPDAQEKVQQGKISELWNQYGNIADVASVYFTGRPYAQAVADGAKDQATGMSVQAYVAKATEAFNKASKPDVSGVTRTLNGKPQTEIQTQVQGYAERTDASDKIISTQGSKFTGKGNVINGLLFNFMKGPELQQYEQAQRDFINAVLRRESGAAISDGEFANAKSQYFPQPGDTPEVVLQKEANRKLVINNLYKQSNISRPSSSGSADTSNDPLAIL